MSDQDVLDNVRRLLQKALREGRDQAEYLDSWKAILTDTVRKQLVVQTLQDLQRDLEGWRPAEYLRRVNKTTAPTATDMYNAILGYVSDYVNSKASE